ncbi:MAG: gamma-glutamyltransferase [Gammaproteobacteria bacterium]|nr:gamma-glutamyltransferase [Gammaproteobacteria bacterium]
MNAKGAVAAGHPLTAETACTVLREGGNAFDAALAALCSACLAEPVLASLGGGGFLLAASPDHGDRVYDFFVHTPRRRRVPDELDFYPVTVDFGTATQEFHIGNGAIATPGVVRGMFAVHADLGHMPMGDIVAQAVTAAREGVALNALQAYILSVVAPIYTATDSACGVYTRDGDAASLLCEGDKVRSPDWADMLESLAREGDRLFYEGELAQLIIEQNHAGGQLSADDLRAYTVQRRAPLSIEFHDAQLLTNPPPSSGGILIGFALKLLQDAPADLTEWETTRYWKHLADVMALTNEARVAAMSEPVAPSEALLDAEFVARYRAEVAGRARALRGTTHISVIDARGNAASLSLSNGEGCGSIVPGTGIMLNNMLGEEDLNPHGFHAWQQDQRMTSMMAPSVIRDSREQRRIVLGSGGSNRIRTAILQVLMNLLALRMPIEDAVAHRRIHCERGFLNIEQGDPQALQELLQAWPEHKIWPEQNMFFGGVHCVMDTEQGVAGAGDARRGGVYRVA